MQGLIDLFSNVTLLNNLMLLVFFIGFTIVFFKASNDPANKLHWTDMLLDTDTKRLSVSKLGNFMGIALSSWVIIYFVQVKESYAMFPTLFMGWLAFLGGVYTLNNFIKAKRANDDTLPKDSENDTLPPPAPPKGPLPPAK